MKYQEYCELVIRALQDVKAGLVHGKPMLVVFAARSLRIAADIARDGVIVDDDFVIHKVSSRDAAVRMLVDPAGELRPDGSDPAHGPGSRDV